MKPFDSQIPNVREIPSHSSENEQIRILVEPQREQILADCQADITACYSRRDSDMLLVHRRLELESDHVKTIRIICVVSHSCMVAEPVILELRY